jgi:hypothetical protein
MRRASPAHLLIHRFSEGLLAWAQTGDCLLGRVGGPTFDLEAERPQRVEAIDLP